MISDLFFLSLNSAGEFKDPFGSPLNLVVEFIKRRLTYCSLHSAKIVVACGVNESSQTCAKRVRSKLATNGLNVDQKMLPVALFGGLSDLNLQRDSKNLSQLLCKLMEFLCPYLFCLPAKPEAGEEPKILCCVVSKDIMDLLRVLCDLPDELKKEDAFHLHVKRLKSSIQWVLFGKEHSDPLKNVEVDPVAYTLLQLFQAGSSDDLALRAMMLA